MKAPYFWYKKSHIPKLLRPFSKIYEWIHKQKWKRAHPYHASVPVICVGNVVMGGAGKTPCAISIVKFLQEKDYQPHIISRGYKGKFCGKVCLEKHTFKDVGDEAIMLAKIAPTWVGKDRVKNVKDAVLNGATHIILDDGFQNPSLYKDFSIIVENKKQKCGNGMVFPAGPLRESALLALKRAHYIWSVDEKIIGTFPKEPVVAFAGIGYPKKFFESLKKNGVNVVKEIAFPDHYVYTERDVRFLLKEATKKKAKLATTTKDAVRLYQFHHLVSDHLVFDVRVEIPKSLATALSVF